MTEPNFTVRVDLYMHTDTGQLDRIESALAALTTRGEAIMADLSAIQSQVVETTTIEESAIVLINGLADQLEAAGNDPAEVQGIVDQLRASSTDLAAAVLANTAAPPA